MNIHTKLELQGVFGMNQVSSENAWWKYWVCIAGFTVGTIMMAFGLQNIVPQWRRGRGKE